MRVWYSVHFNIFDPDKCNSIVASIKSGNSNNIRPILAIFRDYTDYLVSLCIDKDILTEYGIAPNLIRRGMRLYDNTASVRKYDIYNFSNVFLFNDADDLRQYIYICILRCIRKYIPWDGSYFLDYASVTIPYRLGRWLYHQMNKTNPKVLGPAYSLDNRTYPIPFNLQDLESYLDLVVTSPDVNLRYAKDNPYILDQMGYDYTTYRHLRKVLH